MKTAVLIPLYNHAAYIGEALASVAAQTRPADRVLIVDDGSTDGSREAVRAFLAAAPETFRARTELFPQENAGAHVALNRLVQLAGERGCETVAILNSDDRFHPERLSWATDFLRANPDAALVCTRLRLIDAAGAPLPDDHPRTRWLTAAWDAGAAEPDAATGLPDLPGWIGRANFAATTSNFLARTDWLRAHPFGAYRYAHDYAVLVRAALEGVLRVPAGDASLDYRVHADNTVNAPPERLAAEMLRVGFDLARELADRLMDDPPLRAAYARWRRATWENVSLFHGGLFESLAARALADLSTENFEEALADPRLAPDLARPTNAALADARARPGALAARCEVLEAQLEGAGADIQARAEVRRLQNLLLGSRWFALGRLLGQVRPLHQAGGKSAGEKLDRLRERVRCSPWLALGRRLGSRSAVKIAARVDGVEIQVPHSG